MYVDFDGEKINVIIKRKKIKNIYFRWENENLVVTCSLFVTNIEIKKMIAQNFNSLKKLKLKSSIKKLNDDEIYFLGDKYKIVFGDYQIPSIKDDIIYVKDENALDSWLLNQCKIIFSNRLQALKLQFSNLPEFTLRIRKMKTRWGVCNIKSMTVTLNFELIKKDVSLIDYVIIHELCHFKHMNHSKDFWKEVSKYYPYYKKARLMLRG